jgi:hypothetical protein
LYAGNTTAIFLALNMRSNKCAKVRYFRLTAGRRRFTGHSDARGS